jgi:hypothetical protein
VAAEIIADGVKLAFEGHDNVTGRPMVWTMGVATTTPATAPQVADIATAAGNFWTGVKAQVPGTFTLDSIVATALDTATSPQYVLAVGTPGTNGDGAPQQALVIELHTALRGRRYRGKFYLPVPTTHVTEDTGAVDPTLINNVLTALTAFNGALAVLTNVSALAVLSRKFSSLQKVTSYVGRITLVLIRRRLLG